MKEFFVINSSERDALIVHVVFTVLCVIVLFIPLEITVGLRLFILVVAYNLMIPLVSFARGHEDWLSIWSYVIVLSILQVFPDWYLSAQLDVLVFPNDGFPKIGTVSGYMAGLWAIPLFMILFIGLRLRVRYKDRITYLGIAIASLLVFGLSEETLWVLPAWHAQNVLKVDHIAVYIIVPEILLGMTTFWSYEYVKEKEYWFRVIMAFLIMILYLGNAAFFYFLIEEILIV
ncbi:MAG: DUF6989 domain-containing protein [Candidatus Hodarchaeales archaeon]|jgi:hypothetical protein